MNCWMAGSVARSSATCCSASGRVVSRPLIRPVKPAARAAASAAHARGSSAHSLSAAPARRRPGAELGGPDHRRRPVEPARVDAPTRNQRADHVGGGGAPAHLVAPVDQRDRIGRHHHHTLAGRLDRLPLRVHPQREVIAIVGAQVMATPCKGVRAEPAAVHDHVVEQIAFEAGLEPSLGRERGRVVQWTGDLVPGLEPLIARKLRRSQAK